jgi:hypothetical protein
MCFRKLPKIIPYTKNNKIMNSEEKSYREDKKKKQNEQQLCSEYIDKIINYETLSIGDINNIRNMSDENKMDIILAFNNVSNNIIDIINNDPVKQVIEL